MERLRSADFQAALGFLERIGAAPDLDAFAEILISHLDEVIPADIVAYNEVNPVLRRASVISRPDANKLLPAAEAVLERHMHENPLVVHHARSSDGHAYTWSDFISQRQLHATALYNGLFRPLSIERQMVATLPAPEPLLIGVVLNRSGSDFSERDRAMLNLLRPHLINAYRNAQARSLLAPLAFMTGERGEAGVLIGALGEPLVATPRVRELLSAFGDGVGPVPDGFVEWFRRQHSRAPLPPEPLVATRGDLTVEARLLSPSVVALRPLRQGLEPASLAHLGLAPRECEVLALAAEGHTNRQIALRINIAPATVKTHLEHIYEKLGVASRTAAAAAAFRAAASGESANGQT